MPKTTKQKKTFFEDSNKKPDENNRKSIAKRISSSVRKSVKASLYKNNAQTIEEEKEKEFQTPAWFDEMEEEDEQSVDTMLARRAKHAPNFKRR